MVERISLTDMKVRETGRMAEILGGREVQSRLGLRPGVKIVKVGAVSSRGPVVIQVGGTQVSLGFGVSYKIVVEVDR